MTDSKPLSDRDLDARIRTIEDMTRVLIADLEREDPTVERAIVLGALLSLAALINMLTSITREEMQQLPLFIIKIVEE